MKGACGIGLGFSCQDLLTRVEAAGNANMDKETYKMQEGEFLGRIVRTLSLILCQLNHASSNILESLFMYFPASTDNMDKNIFGFSPENFNDLEDDIWGVAGLVIGLASSVGAIYRAGMHDAVLKIKDLIISWIPHADSSTQTSGFCRDKPDIVLSIGSCLALPTVVAFCERVDLLNDNELDHLVNAYTELISELLSVNNSGSYHWSLLMASCVGAGSLLACILNEGVHSIEVEQVEHLLELFRKCYSNPFPSIVHLGGILGVVNALGAGAGNLIYVLPLSPASRDVNEEKVVVFCCFC